MQDQSLMLRQTNLRVEALKTVGWTANTQTAVSPSRTLKTSTKSEIVSKRSMLWHTSHFQILKDGCHRTGCHSSKNPITDNIYLRFSKALMTSYKALRRNSMSFSSTAQMVGIERRSYALLSNSYLILTTELSMVFKC